LYQKIALLTERGKKQARFHARFLGSAAVASSLTAQWQHLAWQHGLAAQRHQGMAAPAARAAAVVMKTPVLKQTQMILLK
jgi:hypothetical protein